MGQGRSVLVLDLDGTLVDSVYVHAVAWRLAFQDVGLTVPSARLHRAIGMGGDRLVSWIAGDVVEREVGDALRERHLHHFTARLHDVHALDGARELLEAGRDAGWHLALASSSPPDLTDRLLGLVEESHLVETVVTGGEGDSKPDPDLVRVALDRAGDGGTVRAAMMVGDATWDVASAERAGLSCLGLLSGGYSREELVSAGAAEVCEGPRELAERLPGLLGGGDA